MGLEVGGVVTRAETRVSLTIRRVLKVAMPIQGSSLLRKRPPLGPYRRPMPRVLGGFQGGGRFLMSEVPLYAHMGP